MPARTALTPEAQRRFEQLREQYKPKDRPVAPSPVALELGNVAVTLCRDELHRAKQAFEAYRWRESATLFAGVRRQAEAIRAANPAQSEVEAVVASALFGEAASLMNLQEMENASTLLAMIDEGGLTDRQRCSFSSALAQTGFERRARVVLDGIPTATQGESYWREARQIVDLLTDGQMPTPPFESAAVLNVVANYCLTHNLVAKAGEAALQGLEADSRNPILRAGLLSAAMVSLLRTIYEDDVADEGVPISDRRRHAERIAEMFPGTFTAELPDATKLMLLGVGLNYASSLRENMVLRWLLDNTDEVFRERVVSPDGARAFELASEGRLTEALAALPNPDHPWRHELRRCQLLAVAKDVPGAVADLRVLATRWPNRVPIHASLAELLSDTGQHEESAEHAEIVFRLLPTDSIAEMLATSLVNARRGARALEVLADRPENERVSTLRAYAADQAHDPAAATYWIQLLKYQPTNRSAAVRLALAMSRMGDTEGAARQARDLATSEIGHLDRDELAACGQVLSLARFLPGVDELIRRIAEELRTRFSKDDTAEFQRLTLVSALGFPDGVAPIDYARLTRAGHLKSVSLDDVVEMFGKRQDLTLAAHRGYSEGWLSFDSFAEITGVRTANLVVRSTATSAATRLRAPIQPSLVEEPDEIRGKSFICSSLELLMLGHCQLLAQVRDAIGDGRLITTQDVWTRMLEEAYYLEQSAQRDEAHRLRAFVGRLSTIEKTDHAGTEREAAAARECRFVSSTATDASDLDALALLSSIAATGRISQTEFRRAAQHLGKPAVAVAASNPHPACLYFEAGLLDLFDRAGVLDAVFESAERVVVSGRDIEFSRARLRDLELAGEAASLQRDVLQRLGDGQREGWFALIPPLQPPMLPALRDDVDKRRGELLTHSIRALLPIKRLLIERKDWHRITADSFGFDSLGHPEQWRAFAFTPAEGQEFVARHWMRGEREISLSRFIRAFAHGDARVRAIRVLARLGFTDVITASEVVGIAKDFGRVDTGKASDILDGAESSAGDALARGVFCRAQIGMAYSKAAWELATAADSELFRSVPAQLLARLERLDATNSTRLLEQSLANLCIHALDNREASFVPSGTNQYKLDRASPAGALWTGLAEWIVGHSAREASARRAIAHAWELLGERGGPSTQAQWAPLGLVTDILIRDAGVNTDVPSPDAVVAVLSADWKVRPLSTRTVTFSFGESHTDHPAEDLLQAAARILDADTKHGSDGTSVSFEFAPAPGGPLTTVSVPFEAALLRATGGAVRAARRLADHIGVFDGRLYRALLDFASNPKDIDRRKHLAHAACNSPFRLVADDARFVLCLGDRAIASQQGFPGELSELRELLSEPPRMLTGSASGIDETEMPLEFARRLSSDGFWGKRDDQAALLRLASRVPGRLPAVAARSLIEGVDSDELRDIVAVLRSSPARSIGEIAIAAALATYACFGDYDEALKADVVQAISEMLEQESKETPADVHSLAAAEPGLLSAVGRVVGRLSIDPILLKEHAWLTQRLYEWWVRTASSKDVLALAPGERLLGWYEVRTEVLLNVILDVLEVQLIGRSESSLPVRGLVARLVDLACARHRNPFEPSPRIAGWLYWRRPQGVGWLASSIALWIDPNCFFDLRPEIRLAVLDRMPRTNAEAEADGISFASFVPALSRFISRLTSSEVDAVRVWLGTSESGVLLDLWRADVLTSFVAAHGDASDAAQLRALARLESLKRARAELLAGYLESIASSERSELYQTVFEMGEAIGDVGGPDVLARALEMVLKRPHAEAVKKLLRLLDEQATVSEARNGSSFIAAVRNAIADDTRDETANDKPTD